MRRRQILAMKKEQEKTMTTSSATATVLECKHDGKFEYDEYSDTKTCTKCGAYWAAENAPKKKRGRPKRSE